MDEEDHIIKQIRNVFGDKSLYEILEIAKTSSEEQIKKGYRKLALRYHPDKGGDPEHFKALSMVYSILSDPTKKKLYDETGSIFTDDLDQSFEFWYDYFRNLFPKLTENDIENYEKKYIGSKDEIQDILDAYNSSKGDMKKIMELVMFAEEGSEIRISKIIDDLIVSEKLKTCKKYEETKKKVLGLSKKRKLKKPRDNDFDLAQSILKKQSSKSSTPINSLFSRYDKEGLNDEYDIPDEEFEKIRSKITKKK